jgi:hypothetical protein
MLPLWSPVLTLVSLERFMSKNQVSYQGNQAPVAADLESDRMLEPK